MSSPTTNKGEYAMNIANFEDAQQASSSEPCPLCGKQHYCYLIPNHQGEISKVICQWTDVANPPPEWNHSGTAKDGRPIFVKQGLERKRRKNSQFPEIIQLNPQSKNIPQWQGVHIPVELLEKGHTVKLKPGSPGGKNTFYIFESTYRRSTGGLFAKLRRQEDSLGGVLEVPLTDIAEIVTYDPKTGAKEIFIEYSYSETQKVVRKQWTDRRKVYQGTSKEVRPWYKVSDTWIPGKGDSPWGLYREEEAIAAIKDGEIIFSVAGEQSVEALRQIGLTAVTNQGGEGNSSLIPEKLAEVFQQVLETGKKPLLVMWGDNDKVGLDSIKKQLKTASKHGVTAVVINLELLISQLPEDKRHKADAHDWVEHCKQTGINPQAMCVMLETAIEAAIETQEQEAQWRMQRQTWKTPDSYKGEIGFWKEEKPKKGEEGESTRRYFEPYCNFDFYVERELEDAEGGGLVLQIKRSFENRQYRVLINSTSYTKVDTFVDTLKRELGTGIVCNLAKSQLNALIHTRLHEYRTNRQGKVFKRIARYGQQEDGTWVFSDRQYKADGTATDENESGWVFNPSLGKDDYIPSPQLAPENNLALQNLVDACWKFFGDRNIYQVLLMMGWTTAALQSQEIFKNEGSFPLFNAHGEPGSCKTIAAETCLSLIGKNWTQDGMIARVSTSALYEHGSRTGSLPFFWDDPDRSPETEELCKSWYNWKPRKVRGNQQTPHSPMGITSNHVIGGEQPATFTRFVRVNFDRASGGDKLAFQELKQAQKLASGAFPQLIQIGYPREEIALLEQELLQYLPHAHARIAQNLAIVTWYSQKVVELTGGTEDMKQWVIENCCPSENDIDNVGDSLGDFIDKILALEAEAQIGDWNFKRDVVRNGQNYFAIYADDVWKLVDQHLKPTTYNKKSLKSLVIKDGGVIDTTVRFNMNRDETLAYKRALLTASQDFSPKPPQKTPRKAWLIPAHLFPEEMVVTEKVTTVTSCNQDTVTPSSDCVDSVSTSHDSECNDVTQKKNEFTNNYLNEIKSARDTQTHSVTDSNSSYSSYNATLDEKSLQNQGFETVTTTQTTPVTSGYNQLQLNLHVDAYVAAADPCDRRYKWKGQVKEVSADGSQVLVCWALPEKGLFRRWHEISYLRMICP